MKLLSYSIYCSEERSIETVKLRLWGYGLGLGLGVGVMGNKGTGHFYSWEQGSILNF